jgi:hypothetical protein
MAFLGDFGRYFLDGKTTQEVGRDVGKEVDLFFGGTGERGAGIGDNIGSTLGNIGSGTADQPQGQTALPTPPGRRSDDQGSQETSTSGTTFLSRGNSGMTSQAGLTSLLPLLTGAGRLLSSKGGQIATGVGLGATAIAQSMGGRVRPVLTQSRRNKAKVRQLVNFMGIEGTADFLSQSIGQNVSPNDVVALLLRTFRNDGAFITKAQVRNLRRTTNRFKSLEKQVKEAVSMGTTRRAPVRRTVNRSTSIKI